MKEDKKTTRRRTGVLPQAPKPLDWTEILNEEAAWHDYADFRKWFSETAPGLPVPDPAACQKFRADLSIIRLEAASIYFGKKPNLSLINDRLRGVSLEIDAQVTQGTRLPPLLDSGGEILSRLFGGLLVGFAQFVADCERGGPGLCRCQGVFRDARMAGTALPDYETDYRKEIELLQEQHLIGDPAIQRCADFFVGRSKARFCSDNCRFITFQISKQLKEPGYLAEKQRRYRNRLKDSAETSSTAHKAE